MRRQAARTVLLVGEGDAEVLFLQHLKGLYVQRGSGVVVTIKNARGKGAAHVVDFARRQSNNAAYDVVAVVLDTDTDWNDRARAAARKAKIQVIPCEPCFEAVLLLARSVAVDGRQTAQLKKDFVNHFGAEASDSTILRHFPREVIEEAKLRVGVLRALLSVLTNAPIGRWQDFRGVAAQA